MNFLRSWVAMVLAGSAALLGQMPGWAARPVSGCQLPATESVFAGQRWVQGVVPYGFAANVSASMQAAMVAAMGEIEAVANVRFVVRGSQPDWVLIRDSVLNSSAVGRVGGAQLVHVYNWNQRFVMVHELMHVLGFWHEHQRPDRDQYVAVQTGNVEPAELFQFSVVPTGTTQGSPYDFDSVLHVDQFAWSANGQPTLQVLPPNQGRQTTIGQRAQLSSGDRAALRLVYGSPVPPTLVTVTPDATTAWQPQAVTLAGQLLDEATRVFVDATPIGAFTRPTPDQIRFQVPALLLIGNHTVSVESQTGRSNALPLRITGNDPPVLDPVTLVVRGLPANYRLHGDAVRTNALLASFDLQPSGLAGFVQLGIGAQFTTLIQVASGIGQPNGNWVTSVTVPTTVPSGVNLHFQAVVFDPANLVLPLPASNVVTTRTF